MPLPGKGQVLKDVCNPLGFCFSLIVLKLHLHFTSSHTTFIKRQREEKRMSLLPFETKPENRQTVNMDHAKAIHGLLFSEKAGLTLSSILLPPTLPWEAYTHTCAILSSKGPSLSLNLCVAADRKISSPQCPALQQRRHFRVADHYFEMPTRFSNKNLEVGVTAQTTAERCSLAFGQWLAQFASPHQDGLSNSGTAHSGLDPLISIINPENTLQASPWVNLMEVIPQVRFSLPKKLLV